MHLEDFVIIDPYREDPDPGDRKVCVFSTAWIMGSNPTEGVDACLLSWLYDE